MVGVLARLVVSHEPMPGFGFDPLVQVPPAVGMGPTASLLLDAGTLVAASVVLWLLFRQGMRIHAASLALALLGCIAALLHALVLDDLNIEALRIGSSWCAAMAGAVALWHAARSPVIRRAGAAALLAVIVVLALRGLEQIVIQHPATVANFEASRTEILQAQGMRDGSPQALAFERRLRQPDATGWLGLTNVFMSMVLASAFACAALLPGIWKRARAAEEREASIAALALIGILASCLGVWLAGPLMGGSIAKGPIGALLLAGVLFSAGVWLGKRSVWLGWIGLVALAAPLLAVTLRGLVGEALDERSLWFRWMYLVGAARVFLDHPLLGVGPDGFQAAYLLAKPPISPEQVTSPHSIFADWLSTLGALGLAWSALLVAAAIRVSTNLRSPDTSEAESNREDETSLAPDIASASARPATVWLGGTFAFTLVWHLWFEVLPVAAAVDGGGPVLIAGIARSVFLGLVATAAGYGIIRLATDRSVRIALAGAGLLLLSHMQIEMLATTPGSAAWVLALIAIAAAPTGNPRSREPGSPPPREATARLTNSLVLSFAVIGGLVTSAALTRVARWEAGQMDASRHLTEVTSLLDQLNPETQPFGELPPAERADILLRLRTIAGASPSMPPAELIPRARLASIDEAAADLESAASFGEDPLRTLRELSNVYRAAAAVDIRLGRDPAEHLGLALAAAERAVDRWPTRTGGYNALALSARLAWEHSGDPSDAARAAEALEQAARLDPHGLAFTWARLELAIAMGDDEATRTWARRSLDLHETLKLDPLAQLTEERLEKAHRAAGIAR